MGRVVRGGRVDVDDVEFRGRGLSRECFGAWAEVAPDPDALSGRYLVLMAHHEADAGYPARARREARVLEWVSPRARGLQVPRVLAVLEDPRGPVLVESVVLGLAQDLRVARTPEPWRPVAAAAAAVHRIEAPPADVLAARDRRQHRIDTLTEVFDGREVDAPELADALAWMRGQVDRSGPGVLVHGDLLGHNLRLFPGDELPGVIDWEYAEVGDPAYDLAIVTRGVRRPFQCDGGRERLLAAYAARADVEVTADDLRFFELSLQVRWSRLSTHAREEHLRGVARLLRGA